MSVPPLVPLKEVALPVSRAVAPIAGDSYRQLGVRLWGQGAYEREPVDGSQTKYQQLFRAERGDIVVNKIWARNGSVAVVDEGLSGCYGSSEFPMFTPIPERLDSRWMHWVTKSRDFWSQCDLKSQGTSGQNRIKPEQFLEVGIPLPPLDQQRHTVARIEGLAAKLDEAQRWRAESIEDTVALKDSRLRQMVSELRSAPRLEVGALCEVRGGIQKTPARAPRANPVRYITVAHVQRGHLNIAEARYFQVSPDELERWRLQAGDILIIEGNGSADQIGRACLFRGEIQDCVHQNHVIRVRPDKGRIQPEYLNFFLNSPAGRDEVQSLSRTTSGLRTLSVGRIRSIKVPVPALAEQVRLLERARAYVAAIEGITALQMSTARELDAMLPAILDKAFKGEL